jgi:hypothetical protein
MYQIGFRMIVILFFSTWLFGCKNADNGNMIIVEPAGSSFYYITNQTDNDLSAEFPIPFYDRTVDKVILVDSIVQIPNQTTVKIFEESNFGFNPIPSHTFKEIRFYKIAGEQKTLVLNIKPVTNEQWISKIISRGEDGYGLTEYQFAVKKEDLQ